MGVRILNAPECRAALFKANNDTVLTTKGKRDKIQRIMFDFLVSNGYPEVAKVYDEILREIDADQSKVLLDLLGRS